MRIIVHIIVIVCVEIINQVGKITTDLEECKASQLMEYYAKFQNTLFSLNVFSSYYFRVFDL